MEIPFRSGIDPKGDLFLQPGRGGGGKERGDFGGKKERIAASASPPRNDVRMGSRVRM